VVDAQPGEAGRRRVAAPLGDELCFELQELVAVVQEQRALVQLRRAPNDALHGRPQQHDAGRGGDGLRQLHGAGDQEVRHQGHRGDEQRRIAHAGHRAEPHALADQRAQAGQALVVQRSPAAVEETRQPEGDHLVGMLAVRQHAADVRAAAVQRRHFDVEGVERLAAPRGQEQDGDRACSG
jgi:hypothetical protein